MNYGQNIKFKVLEVNESEEKIRLGIKQIEEDEFLVLFKNKKKSDVVTVTVSNSTANGIYVRMGNKNFSAFIKSSTK